jgi:hypothetical protein
MTHSGNLAAVAITVDCQVGLDLEQICSLVIEKRGTPTAVLLNIRDYVKLAAPEPEVLRVIGDEDKRNMTTGLTSRQIDQVIKAARSEKKKR